MHTHMQGVHFLATFLAMIALFGTAKLLAMRFEGHPLADAWSDLF